MAKTQKYIYIYKEYILDQVTSLDIYMMLSFRCYACWWIPKIVSDMSAKKSTAKVYVSHHRRAAHIVPTKRKLLLFAQLDCVVNLPKQHFDVP